MKEERYRIDDCVILALYQRHATAGVQAMRRMLRLSVTVAIGLLVALVVGSGTGLPLMAPHVETPSAESEVEEVVTELRRDRSPRRRGRGERLAPAGVRGRAVRVAVPPVATRPEARRASALVGRDVSIRHQSLLI